MSVVLLNTRLLLIIALVISQEKNTYSQPDELCPKQELHYIINYLELSQQKENNPPKYYKGEWPSYIENLKTILFLGKKGKKAYDSNCMTSSLIFNMLANYSIRNPDNNKVKNMLINAIGNFEYYRVGDVFSFWHELERAEHLQRNKHKKNPEKYYQRRANNFYYKSRFVNSMMDITPDLDNAASVWLSYELYNTIFHTDSMSIPFSPGEYLDNFSDLNRKNVHFYNFFKGHGRETGAFLTWFRCEEKTGLPYVLPLYSNYIPFGINDKDAVVNANIIYSLIILKDTLYPSYKNSAEFINYCFRKNKHTSAGNYYPTRFSLHYATSKVYWAGCKRLKESVVYIYSQLKSQQLENGSYPCDIENNEIQSTIYALNSMIYLKMAGHNGLDENINLAFNFVMSKKKNIGNITWWPGGVSGSAGSFARKSHIWRSDAYTSTLVLEALSNYYE